MLKLIPAVDMDFEYVREYYHSFVENNSHDINNPAIILVEKGANEYYRYLFKNNPDLYYLIDTKNSKFIIGYGSIRKPDMPNYDEIYHDIGNIGFGIRPDMRGMGYGNKLLQLLLNRCKFYGMKEVYVSCSKNNVACQEIILNNNGVFKKEFYDEFDNCGLKYFVKLEKNNVLRKLLK